MNRIRLLLVSHQPIICAGLRLLLEGQAELLLVGEVATSAEALEAVSRANAQVLLLTPLGKEEATFQLLSDLAARALDTRVLLLTSNDAGAGFCRTAISLGVVGIVYQEQSVDNLMRAIKCVAEGEVWLERSLLATFVTELSRSTSTAATVAETRQARAAATAAKPIDKLTPRELELIALIGEGLKNRQIAERLFINELTVRNHLASIYSKLGVSNRLALAIYAYNNGLLETLPN